MKKIIFSLLFAFGFMTFLPSAFASRPMPYYPEKTYVSTVSFGVIILGNQNLAIMECKDQKISSKIKKYFQKRLSKNHIEKNVNPNLCWANRIIDKNDYRKTYEEIDLEKVNIFFYASLENGQNPKVRAESCIYRSISFNFPREDKKDFAPICRSFEIKQPDKKCSYQNESDLQKYVLCKVKPTLKWLAESMAGVEVPKFYNPARNSVKNIVVEAKPVTTEGVGVEKCLSVRLSEDLVFYLLDRLPKHNLDKDVAINILEEGCSTSYSESYFQAKEFINEGGTVKLTVSILFDERVPGGPRPLLSLCDSGNNFKGYCPTWSGRDLNKCPYQNEEYLQEYTICNLKPLLDKIILGMVKADKKMNLGKSKND